MNKKQKIMNVLMGLMHYDTLTSEEINFASKNLPNNDEASTSATAPIASKIDISGLTFNHASSSFTEAIGLTDRAPILISRKIEDIEMEQAEREVKKKSITVQLTLEALNLQEVAYLVNLGIEHLAEIKQKQAISSLLGDHIKKLRRGDSDDSGFSSFED